SRDLNVSRASLTAFHELGAQPEHEHAELHLVQGSVPVQVPLPHHLHKVLVAEPRHPHRRRVPLQALDGDHPLRWIHQQPEPLAQFLDQPLRPQPRRHRRKEVLEAIWILMISH
ncbi:unnamed protein product, partial [Musa acuminata subsp. malaccensis]